MPRPGSSVPSGARAVSAKQEREERRLEKLEAFRREQARRARNRTIGISAAIIGGVAVIALVVTAVILGSTGARPSYTAGGSGSEIQGVETFENVSAHTTDAVVYDQSPPAGGAHNPTWLNCGVYSEQVPNENAVHSLEHGAIWITYDPTLSDDEVQTLRDLLPSRQAILSPYEGLPSAVVVSGWNSQLQVNSVDDARISAFIEEYWLSQSVPEPGASCTGGLDGPGRVA